MLSSSSSAVGIAAAAAAAASLHSASCALQPTMADPNDRTAALQQQGMQRPSGNPNDPRFSTNSEFDTGRWIIEEIRATPKERGKKLKVNPLIRKMFEKRSESEE